MYINFRAEGQELKRVDDEKVASNSVGFLKARFEYDEEWEGLSLKAVFEQDGSEYIVEVSDGACDIPSEVLNPGRFKVWLVGEDAVNGIYVTTVYVIVPVQKGPNVERALPPGGSGGGGSVNEADITSIVDTYLDENLDERVNAILEGDIDEKLNEAIDDASLVNDFELAKSCTSRYTSQNELVTLDESTVDIALFAGQSNSCGRAQLSDCTTDKDLIISCPMTSGFSFNNTASEVPVQIVEPITANGTSGYGYIPAFINAYRKTTGRKICACYCSDGGVMLKKFVPYALDDVTGEEKTEGGYQKKFSAMTDAVNFAAEKLVENGYKVGNIFLVWCQGESDAAYLGTDSSYASTYEKALQSEADIREYYKSNFTRLFELLGAAAGVSTAFIIRIGHKKNADSATAAKYANMIEAQNELCRENPDMVMVSCLFAGANAFIEEDGSVRNLMRSDTSHYLPEGYLRAGLEAGINAGLYNRSGRTKKPVVMEYHPLFKEDNTLYERAADKYLYDPYKNEKADLDFLSGFVSREVESISLSASSTQLEVGKTLQLICSFTPAGSYGAVAYTSLDTSIATVDSKGLVTGVAQGNVTISASLGDTDITASIALTVTEAQQGGEEEGGDDDGTETSDVVFDFDFTQNNLNDYSLSDIFTVPNGSGDLSDIEYDITKGMSLNGELPYGLVLNEPIDPSRAWTLEMTATFAVPTALDGNRRAILNGEATYPCLDITFAGSTVSSIAFMAGTSSSKKRTPQYVIADGAEHSYKITYTEDKLLSFYVDGVFKKSFDGNSDASFEGYTGSFTHILGLAEGQSTAYIWQNTNTENSSKSYLKKLSFTYGVTE